MRARSDRLTAGVAAVCCLCATALALGEGGPYRRPLDRSRTPLPRAAAPRPPRDGDAEPASFEEGESALPGDPPRQGPAGRERPGTADDDEPDEVAMEDEQDSETEAEKTSRDTDEDFETRIKKLEETWKKHQDAEDKKKADAAKKPTVKIGGRIHLDYWSFPETTEGIDYFENPVTGVDVEDRVLFRRIRLEMEGDVFENMLWRMQIDFNDPSNPQMKDVYLGFKELPHNQQLLIGHQKRPLGLDHLNSSRFNVFLERPLVVEAFNQDARRIGACMYGHTDDEAYHWRYGVYLLEDAQDDAQVIGDSMQGSLNARLASSPWYDETSGGRGYFHWAVAGMLARPDGDADPSDTNRNEARFRTRGEVRTSSRWLDTLPIRGADWYEILGLEAMLNVGAFQLTAEYQSAWVQREFTTRGTGPDVRFHGGYAQFSYFLTGEHIPYERTSGTIGRVRPFENFFLVERCRGGCGLGWGAWQIGARVSYLDLTDGDIFGGEERTLGGVLNWYWNAHARVQNTLEYGEIENHFPVGPLSYTSGRYIAFGARFSVDF